MALSGKFQNVEPVTLDVMKSKERVEQLVEGHDLVIRSDFFLKKSEYFHSVFIWYYVTHTSSCLASWTMLDLRIKMVALFCFWCF